MTLFRLIYTISWHQPAGIGRNSEVSAAPPGRHDFSRQAASASRHRLEEVEEVNHGSRQGVPGRDGRLNKIALRQVSSTEGGYETGATLGAIPVQSCRLDTDEVENVSIPGSSRWWRGMIGVPALI